MRAMVLKTQKCCGGLLENDLILESDPKKLEKRSIAFSSHYAYVYKKLTIECGGLKITTFVVKHHLNRHQIYVQRISRGILRHSLDEDIKVGLL